MTSEQEQYGGVLESPDKLRDKAKGRTFVFTSAQNNTKLHDAFFASLLHYCEATDAELHISRFTYNKNSMGSNNRKVGTAKASDSDEMWYDPRIEQYASDQSLEITPDLVWCGELNIIPTRIDPVSGFTTYTRDASAIIPHVKMRMQSVPTMKNAPAKFVYTTGAITQRNYVQRAAGQRADFHHVFGALVVEVDADGTWWARQLNATSDGSFYDLDAFYTPDGVWPYPIRVQAITHGDLHGNKLDQAIAAAVFNKGGVLDQLKPREQFFHDTVDFQPRNHHNIKDGKFLYQMWKDGTDSVEQEFERIAEWMATTAVRSWCRSFVVVSNHDQAIETWLSNPVALQDPPNLQLWHRLNLNSLIYEDYSPFIGLLDGHLVSYGAAVEFLREDDSYKILGEIEAGLHGHLGPNGARGNPKNLRTVGKANTGHTHSAGIVEGIYTAGVYGTLDMGYNKGLSSWSHSMIVTYANGKRTILTLRSGRAWR